MFNKKLYHVAAVTLFIIFSFGTRTSANVTATNVTIDNKWCQDTVGTCIGQFFDQIVLYLDNLGFLDVTWAIAMMIFQTSMTLLTYPSVQFIVLWASILFLLGKFFRPLLCLLWCITFPCRKIAVEVMPECVPCSKRSLGLLSRNQQSKWKNFLAQSGKEDAPDSTTGDHPEPNVQVLAKSQMTYDSTSGTVVKTPIVTPTFKVSCEEHIEACNTNTDNCTTKLVHSGAPDVCGSIAYNLSKQVGKPKCWFKNEITWTSLTGSTWTRISRVNATINQTTGQLASIVLYRQPINVILNTNAVYRRIRAQYTMFRFKMRFILVPQQSSSALGSVIMYHKPIHVGVTPPGNNEGADWRALGYFNHVWLQCSSDECAVLECDFPSAAELTNVIGTAPRGAGNFPYDASMYGWITVMVGHPLSVPTGVQTTLNYELHMQLFDIQVSHPFAPLFTTQGLIDIDNTYISKMENSTMSKKTTEGDFNTTVPIGLDYIGDSRQNEAMIRRTFPKFVNSRGKLDVHRTTINGCDATDGFVEGQDETDIGYLMNAECWLDSFTITSGTAKGSLIGVVDISPDSNDAVNPHNWWSCLSRGGVWDSVDIIFRIPKAAYQTGKLIVILAQNFTGPNGNQTIPASLTTSHDMLALPCTIIDLNSCDFEHVITIPWHTMMRWVPGFANSGQDGYGNSMWQSNTTLTPNAMVASMPYLAIYNLIPMGTSVNVANTCNIIVSRRYNNYRAVWGQCPNARPTYIYNAQGGFEKDEERFEMQGKCAVPEVMTHKPSMHGRDDIVSLKQIWLRPHFLRAGDIGRDSASFIIRHTSMISSLWGANMYNFHSGTLRLLLVFSNIKGDYLNLSFTHGAPATNSVAQPSDGLAKGITDFQNNIALFINNPQKFVGTTYNLTWGTCGTTNNMVLIDKASPWVIVEIPLDRPWGPVSLFSDNYATQVTVSPANFLGEAVFCNMCAYVMCGDDYRATHLANLPSTIVNDTVDGDVQPPWSY